MFKAYIVIYPFCNLKNILFLKCMMSHFFSIVHPPPPSIAPAPPLGYPTKQENPQNLAGETKSKGGGFWKGW
jgi:hypothetical protein